MIVFIVYKNMIGHMSITIKSRYDRKMLKAFPPENSQRHSLEQEITLALILKSHSKSAAQILKKLDRRFPHGAGRLDSNWLENEALAKIGVLGDFPDFSGVGDGSSGERGSYQVRR